VSDGKGKEGQKESGEGGEGGEDEGAEKAFWAKMDGRIDAGIDRALGRYKVTGQSRNGGRTTVPGMLADIMFGKQKAE